MATTLITSGAGYLYWLLAAHTFTAFQVGLGSGLITAFGLISYIGSLGIGFYLHSDASTPDA